MTAITHIRPRLSVAKLAEAWGCSRQHIYTLIERGDLPALRIGSLIRIRPEDVEAFEAQQCQGQKQSSPPSRSSEESVSFKSNGGGMGDQDAFYAAQRIRMKMDAHPGYLAGLRSRQSRALHDRNPST